MEPRKEISVGILGFRILAKLAAHLRSPGGLHAAQIQVLLEAPPGLEAETINSVRRLLQHFREQGLVICDCERTAGGKETKYYALTPAGKQAFRLLCPHWKKVADCLCAAIGEGRCALQGDKHGR